MTNNNSTSSPNGHDLILPDEYVEEVIQEIGGIQGLAREMDDFRETVQTFLEDETGLVERYNNQWVAYHDCRLRAHSDSLDDVVRQLREKGIPQGDALVRFVTDRPRKFIL